MNMMKKAGGKAVLHPVFSDEYPFVLNSLYWLSKHYLI